MSETAIDTHSHGGFRGAARRFASILRLAKPRVSGEQGGNRFTMAVERISSSPLYCSKIEEQAPLGFYEGRPIIADSNIVNGGVYLGVIPHEALVVDEKYGALADIYNQLIMRFVQDGNKRDSIEENILGHVAQFVREKLKFDPDKVRRLAFEREIAPDRKAALDFYLNERTGAARHQVLLAAYLMQRMRERGLIKGSVRIDPIFSQLPAEDERLIYKPIEGPEFVFDPAAG